MPFIQLQLQLTVSSTKLPTERPIHVCSVVLPSQAPRAMMRRRRSCTASFSHDDPRTPATRKQEAGGGQDRSVDRGRAGQVQLTADLNLGLGQILFLFSSFSHITCSWRGVQVSHILFLIPQLELIFFSMPGIGSDRDRGRRKKTKFDGETKTNGVSPTDRPTSC